MLAATTISGVFLVEAVIFADHRGLFARLYDEEELSRAGVDTGVSQSRAAFNGAAGTLRGLHYQAEPHGDTKVVRCTAGSIFDVVADLRPDSPTCHQWIATELSALNRRSVVVPPGCAHGYLTLSADSEVAYLISVPYVEGAQRGVVWDDPTLAVSWPASPVVISERDLTLPRLAS
ncbi:MAG: dTDP-4-dehydrorhamnose 3,5-epimerase family protein [Acidimicrobiales bacterium]